MKTILKLALIINSTACLAMDPARIVAKLQPKTREAKELFSRALERIKTKQDLNSPTENGNLLLVQAAASDEHLVTTIALLYHGADPNIIDAHGQTPLLCAARACAYRTIRTLVYFKADPNHPCYQEFNYHTTPLHEVCCPSRDSHTSKQSKARLKSIEWLLAAGANANAQDSSGATPFFGLVSSRHAGDSTVFLPPDQKEIFKSERKELINTLITCKANGQIKDHLGHTLFTQIQFPVDSYLSIYIAYKLKQRREKLREVLCTFLKGSPHKPERISPFKNFPPDILRYILKYAYP